MGVLISGNNLPQIHALCVQTDGVSERLRSAVLNVGPLDMTLMKENIVQLLLIDHFPALLALVEVPFIRFA
jgi:hypothetical protein